MTLGGVWTDVVGQESAVAALAAAVAGEPGAMTHAWLVTGPPGSGRSVAARAFAAALQCPQGGCGECPECHTVLTGTHADVEVLTTELLSIGVKETRELVRRAALSPSNGRWQVIIAEDADRLTDQAANALLKAIEEPPPRTVWILCAPATDDVLPTIRSRCRSVHLVTPSTTAVAEVLTRRDGIDPETARVAALASQGHIGRARRLATDADARSRRADVLALPRGITDVGSCLRAAERLIEAVKADVAAASEISDAAEREALKSALGIGTGAKQPPGAATALKELEKRQKARATRAQRDGLDRALVDLVAFYRDVLAVQLGADVEPVNAAEAAAVREIAADSTPESTLRRIEAVLACRTALETNAAPLLAVEAMTLALR
ncbi:DNA polymerase III subunit delta' [Sporichthya polymorpha]|uniref:DNA polymerase III subunit delta' n=1 Tax=Sporichthya polymorpha TaxID=35751 RepID=UPI00037FE2F5|nr:DNA polymerase III subunit delta' [Sporichthya polymorpha]